MKPSITILFALALAATTIQPCAAHGSASRRLSGAEIISEWNERAYESAFAEDQFNTFKGQRALALMHLAQHDALSAIRPIFEPYVLHTRERQAHPRVAAAQAAHDVLVSQYPQDRAKFQALLAKHLARAPKGRGRRAGVELSRRAAADILAARAQDNFDVVVDYQFVPGPGSYQTTPDWNGFVASPGFRFATPFVLNSPDQFRPAPPPALTSVQYAMAFDEIKRFGAKDSTVRTADQTDYAVWWMEFSEGSVNRLARRLAAKSHMNLWNSARMFALINVSLVDSYITVWDSKYHFNHWRPYTAVRAAGDDGNPQTAPDPHWGSLRPAPPFPEYVSAHAAGCASSFRVLEEFFPRLRSFTMRTTTAPPGMPTRSFTSFRAAAHECGDSRVQLGFHFRYATEKGEQIGRSIAEYVMANRLARAGGRD